MHVVIFLLFFFCVSGETISYSGDPLLDFTLIRFLDKFSFKNPKAIKEEEDGVPKSFLPFNKKKHYVSSPVRRLRANTVQYLRLNESSIPADEIFLYRLVFLFKVVTRKSNEILTKKKSFLLHAQRYMKEKSANKVYKKEKDSSDVDSVGSDEFDDLMTDIIDGKKDNIDFHNEVGQLSKKDKKKKNKTSWLIYIY